MILKKILISSCLLFFPATIVNAEDAMQPATIDYDYCNKEGTFCTKSDVQYQEIEGQKTALAGGVNEINSDLMLNLDHYYRNQCAEKLNIPKNTTIPENKVSDWGDCIVQNLANAVQNKNAENIKYLDKTKEIFKPHK